MFNLLNGIKLIKSKNKTNNTQRTNPTKTDEIIIEGPNGTTIIRGGTIELFNAKNQEILSLGYNRKMDGQINIKNNMGYNIAVSYTHLTLPTNA